MGYWSDWRPAEDGWYATARDLLCEAGALRECENHPGSYFDGDGDLEAACQLANARISAGKIDLDPGQTRRSITDLIQGVYHDNAGLAWCPECEKAFGPD